MLMGIHYLQDSYAKFKDEKVPAGEVEVTGATKFNKDYQFMISNYADLVVKGVLLPVHKLVHKPLRLLRP